MFGAFSLETFEIGNLQIQTNYIWVWTYTRWYKITLFMRTIGSKAFAGCTVCGQEPKASSCPQPRLHCVGVFSTEEQIRRVFDGDLRIIFVKTFSNEYPQHMFLWRNKQIYPLIITKYPPCLFHWEYTGLNLCCMAMYCRFWLPLLTKFFKHFFMYLSETFLRVCYQFP